MQKDISEQAIFSNVTLPSGMVFETFKPWVVWQVLKVFEKLLKILLTSITTKHVILIENIKIQDYIL